MDERLLDAYENRFGPTWRLRFGGHQFKVDQGKYPDGRSAAFVDAPVGQFTVRFHVQADRPGDATVDWSWREGEHPKGGMHVPWVSRHEFIACRAIAVAMLRARLPANRGEPA